MARWSPSGFGRNSLRTGSAAWGAACERQLSLRPMRRGRGREPFVARRPVDRVILARSMIDGEADADRLHVQWIGMRRRACGSPVAAPTRRRSRTPHRQRQQIPELGGVDDPLGVDRDVAPDRRSRNRPAHPIAVDVDRDRLVRSQHAQHSGAPQRRQQGVDDRHGHPRLVTQPRTFAAPGLSRTSSRACGVSGKWSR